jgi:hypothetical protein
MVKARIFTYECKQCGSEIIVTPSGESQLSPIYCCGIKVTEISSGKKKPARPKKKTAKKAVKKVSAKKVVAKKKPTAKKKVSKK